MNEMLAFPKDRKPLHLGRFCLLLGLTILLYPMLMQKMGTAGAW
jgi:hypothetical protein